VEGTKTLAYEVWEQSDFRAPDNLVVPLGYGSNVLGAERGFAELARNGEIARRPRLFGVQAARCAPFSAAFHESVEHLVPTPVKPTIAEGIATPKPTRVAEVLRAARETGGTVLAVEEGEIVEALRGLARLGLYVEPTSAVAAAGLTRLLDAGVIRPQEYTVLVLTGSGLKASATVGEVLKLGARSV
jgi:threonine synthase